MILPYANSECMVIFLEEFSKQFPDYRVIMVMDNASWHSKSITKKIENIVPLFQPPYSLNLNPNSANFEVVIWYLSKIQ
jgi:transposase